MNPPPQVPASWVADLFRLFGRLYGVQRMAVMYPDREVPAVVDLWVAELSKLPVHAVRRAIDGIANAERTWPPTLPEFVAMVRAAPTPPAHRQAQLPDFSRDEAARAAGAAHLERIKAMIGRAVKAPPPLAKGDGTPREPGSDDEPAKAPACTCYVGLHKSPMPCPACSSYQSNRQRAVA